MILQIEKKNKNGHTKFIIIRTQTKRNKTNTKLMEKNVKYDVYWPEVKCRKWFVYSVLEGRKKKEEK